MTKIQFTFIPDTEAEYDLMLDLIARAIHEEKEADWQKLLTDNMKSLTRRLNLTLA